MNYRGEHFDVKTARLQDRPDEPAPIGTAVSGPDSCAPAGRQADFMDAVGPEAKLGECSTRRAAAARAG